MNTTATPDLELLPEYVRGHRLATISVKDENDEYQNETVPTDKLDEAEVVTSQSNIEHWFGTGIMHRPVLDIDFPATVIPSTTPGHGHLYIDKLLTWDQYEKLLNVLAEVGIIEQGYAGASIARQHTAVRLPWVRKKEIEL